MSALKQAVQWFRKNIIDANTPRPAPLQIFKPGMDWRERRDTAQTWLRENIPEWPREPMCLDHVKKKHPLPIDMQWWPHVGEYAVWLMEGERHALLFTYEKVWQDFLTVEQAARVNEIISQYFPPNENNK